jgi:hypothetical protein
MLVGYNTNISYKGTVYHIQTEDSGKNNPVILTLLYAQGAILASRKTSYAHLVDDPEFKEKVRDLMKRQHKVMIKELVAGKYSQESSDEAVSEPVPGDIVQQPGEEKEPIPEKEPVPQEEPVREKIQATQSLDDILLNYILKRNS